MLEPAMERTVSYREAILGVQPSQQAAHETEHAVSSVFQLLPPEQLTDPYPRCRTSTIYPQAAMTL